MSSSNAVSDGMLAATMYSCACVAVCIICPLGCHYCFALEVVCDNQHTFVII